MTPEPDWIDQMRMNYESKILDLQNYSGALKDKIELLERRLKKAVEILRRADYFWEEDAPKDIEPHNWCVTAGFKENVVAARAFLENQ